MRLREAVGVAALAGKALELVHAKAPDEGLALAALLKLAEATPEPLRATLAETSLAADLIFCLGSSETVGNYLCGDPLWRRTLTEVRQASAGSLASSIKLEAGAPAGRSEAAAALAAGKRAIFARIAMADLLGRTSVAETMRLMSRLGDECIRAALGQAQAFIALDASAPGFCVLALGKLGVNELNLSSDLDLAYLCATSDPHELEAATRSGELLTELLAGCFRVDLRLRPGGSHAPLVPSLESALSFYQNFGQTWERAALLRARPVAGDIALGRRLLSELNPFIYRRYLDFETLGQLRTMKQMIERELRSPALVQSNIKLGRGGIREIEFIVQALTLVYGGRDARLRYPQTLDALERLQQFGYLTPARARQLAAAYLFLRDVEHKLQVVAGLQTHTLPADETGMARLAARIGFGKSAQAVERLHAVLGKHRDLVAEVFREVLPAEQAEAAVGSSAAHQAFEAALEPDRSAPYLAELGFAQPEESAGHLLLLARGPTHALASPRRRELLRSLGPRLLDEISRLANPDHALANLAAFIAAIGAHTSFLSLLEQHPATREVLLRLFASSQYLSALFIRHPDMIDVLVRSDLARLRRSGVEIRAELRELLAHAEDFESRLDAMRSLRHQEFLRIAIADVAGHLALTDVETELTTLAEAVLEVALSFAREQLSARFPAAGELALCALAMGRLGSGEMSYNSDLDLIFVYDADPAEEGAREVAARIVQKLIAILEARTREGYLYKCDLRLRPSGNAGPLVASLEAFRKYHRGSSAIWERQALIRGRVIAGDERLGAQVEAARRDFVFGRGLDAAGVEEIAQMRRRIEDELGRESADQLNIKQGRGGLVDIEFLTQMMALRHGYRYSQLRARRVRDLLAGLKLSGLMAPADADALRDDYDFLSRLENYLRMDTDQAAWAVSTEPVRLSPMARRLGFEGEEGSPRLLAEIERRRNRVRGLFSRYFAAEGAATVAPEFKN